MASLLSPIFDFCLCCIRWLAGTLLAGIVGIFNLLVAALFGLLHLILGLLPTADLRQLHPPSFVAWTNYFFPLDQFLIATGIVVSVLVAWQVVQVGLRWLKVIS